MDRQVGKLTLFTLLGLVGAAYLVSPAAHHRGHALRDRASAAAAKLNPIKAVPKAHAAQ